MTDAEHPIAWLALGKGTPVYSSDGEEIGKVSTVVADVQKDIFSGIAFKHGFLGSEHFVPADDIDPVFYAKTYHVGAGKDGEDAYRVLHDALERSGRAGIGRFTFHDREYLTALRARDGLLALHTLNFADELVSGEDIDAPEPQRAPGEREVAMARALVDTLHEDFDPARYEDEYRAAVLKVIERKAAGEDVRVEEDEPPPADDDLMAALQASLEGAKGRRR
jgi:DNA end-binding protein Ku